ncbi:hypothetical protein EG833_00660 [archaeon]|nr:hypothetical protein [archaeon]
MKSRLSRLQLLNEITLKGMVQGGSYMTKAFSAAACIMAILMTGCSGTKGYVQGPFASYTHEPFINAETGETVLHIKGESWYALFDARGFKNFGNRLESENQFLSRKNDTGMIMNVSAEKIERAKDDLTCRMKVFSRAEKTFPARIDMQNIGDKRIIVYSQADRKIIDYCLYYAGYCFDFQFITGKNFNETGLSGIMDSIAFIPDNSIHNLTGRLFYVHDKKLLLPILDTWKNEFRTGISRDPSILISPPEGTGFQMFISPYQGFEGTQLSRKKIRRTLEERMAKWDERAQEKPEVKDLVTGDCALSYFEITDRYAYEADPKGYRFVNQGFAVVNNTAFFFTLRFKENGRQDAMKAMKSLALAKVFDLSAEIPIHFPTKEVTPSAPSPVNGEGNGTGGSN